MDDSATQQQRTQGPMSQFEFGEYIHGAASGEGHQQHDIDGLFSDFQHHARNAIDPTMSSQSIVNSHSGVEYMPQGQGQTMVTAEMLKGRLEQQIKLQQLQQLQNQILQQQIELISGQASMNDQGKDLIFHGLLTPGPSSELRAMVSKDLVSPMMLQPEMYINNSPSATAILSQLSPNQNHPNPSMSAPAALAFQTSPPFPLPSPAEPEFDLSPLTSPWLLPVTAAQQQQQTNSQHAQQRSTRLKRAASINGDDQGGMRKRSVHSSIMQARRNGLSPSSSSSTTSTPSVRAGVGSAPSFGVNNDTPSPVDLSMPPPAPPAANNHLGTVSSSASSSTAGSTSVSPNIAPVTPASIMNLQKLSTGLVPSNPGTEGSASVVSKRATVKGKNTTRPGAAGATAAATRGRRGSLAKAGISPNLKPILPGAIAPAPALPLAQTSSSAHLTSGSSSHFALNPNSSGNPPGPRKTSHKDAEQKRRDSLKTSFDELRLLLPPVPLPEEDERPLPGSMPPRGPPKGDADGPNRSVSKLALLRCGNTYIRELKEQVSRRDQEIDKLRDEVRRLRAVAGQDDVGGGVDLEKDVDEGATSVHCPSGCSVGEEGNLDADEEGG